MILSLKGNKNKNTDAPQRGVAAAPPSPVAGFIPYYCHYNHHTLLTKNGELMQVIKIVTNLKGLNYESGDDSSTIVREAIRKAIHENVRNDKFAIWTHTIRKRKAIKYQGKFKENFAAAVHDRWQKIHRWKYQYYNEIYISILYDGQPARLMDTQNFKDVCMPKRNRDFRNAYIDVIYEELDTTVMSMLANIRKTFNAQRLTIVERVPEQSTGSINHAIFYSEPMEFLGTILNLRAEEFILPQVDISEVLASTKHTFGFNALETKSPSGKRRFSAILTLKQYREVPSETIDRLLQAPMEFVISQAFHFVPHTGALKQYREQKELFDISGDLYCIEASGIADMMASHASQPTDFGEHQTSIMVLSDDFKLLDAEISRVQTAFAELGLITIREDIKLEECFWSQLPGNFEFLRRKDRVNTSRIAGFCRLNRFPNGGITGNHWGDALTILPTFVRSPYFFNFHHQDNGHTVLFDFNSFNDQVSAIVLNFLLSESRKYDGRLYIFDRRRSADLFFQRLGGKYYNFSSLEGPNVDERIRCKINPFLQVDNQRNRSFLLAWCGMLISPDIKLPDAQKEALKSAIDQLYSGPEDKRHLVGLIEALLPLDTPLAKAFSKWHGEGVYAGLLDDTEEDMDFREALNAFDMTPVVNKRECIVPIFSYLLHRIITSVDGRPTIIVLHDAFDLLDNDFIAQRLDSLMEMLQQNNAMMIFTTGKPRHAVNSQVFGTIMKNCATHLFFPDDIGRDYAIQELGLSAYDSGRLIRMERQNGDFLLKQNNETIALRADIKELDEIHAVFANDIKNLAAALGKFSTGSPKEG